MAVVGAVSDICLSFKLPMGHRYLTPYQFSQVALIFLNDQCLSTHGKFTPHSIFLSPSGEWKLGGFELLSNSKDEGAVLYVRLQFIMINLLDF